MLITMKPKNNTIDVYWIEKITFTFTTIQLISYVLGGSHDLPDPFA